MLREAKNVRKGVKPFVIDLSIPTEDQILENPKRRDFLGGGWIDSSRPNVIAIYWHKRQGVFTVYSLLQVLEHETMHSVLERLEGLQVSKRLDNVHRSSSVWISASNWFL